MFHMSSLGRWDSSKVGSQSRFSWLSIGGTSSRWCWLLTQRTPSSAPHWGRRVAPCDLVQVLWHFWWPFHHFLFLLHVWCLLHSRLHRFFDHLNVKDNIKKRFQGQRGLFSTCSGTPNIWGFDGCCCSPPLSRAGCCWSAVALNLTKSAGESPFHPLDPLITWCPSEQFLPFPFPASLHWVSFALASPESDVNVCSNANINLHLRFFSRFCPRLKVTKPSLLFLLLQR